MTDEVNPQIEDNNYNTQREQMVIRDYGRVVYDLITYVKSIEDREERSKAAEAVVKVMEQVNPRVRDMKDYRRKLWNHLLIMAGGKLDVDVPYEVGEDCSVAFVPEPVAYHQVDPDADAEERKRMLFYGRNFIDMVKQVSQTPEGEERERLALLLACSLKGIMQLRGGRNDVADDDVRKELEILSGGVLKVPEGVELVVEGGVADPLFEGLKKKKHSKNKKKKK